MDWECVICDKIFRSDKALANHERWFLVLPISRCSSGSQRCRTLLPSVNGTLPCKLSAAHADMFGARRLALTCNVCSSRSKKHLERLADVQEAMLAEEQEVQADVSPATDAALPEHADSGSVLAASDDGEPGGAAAADEPPAARLSKKQQKKKQKQREKKQQAAMAGMASAAVDSDAELAAPAPRRQRNSDSKLGLAASCPSTLVFQESLLSP